MYVTDSTTITTTITENCRNAITQKNRHEQQMRYIRVVTRQNNVRTDTHGHDTERQDETI